MTITLDELGLKYGTDKSSKGHDYLRHYDEYLKSFRDEEITLIEIGGLHGASLKMWSDYLPKATILCLDINSDVKKYEQGHIKVEIGNAAAPAFLRKVVEQYGKPTIVLDDGSHRWDHQRIAFEILFPELVSKGVYIVEDLHSNFEPKFAGKDTRSFVDYINDLGRFMHLRGSVRRDFIKDRSKLEVSLAKMMDSFTYVPSSCIIKKYAEAV